MNMTALDWQRCSCQYGYDRDIRECAVTMPMKYLNSGFYIGPAGDISDMLTWVLNDFDETILEHPTFTDQRLFARYWLANPSKVTLDYTSELSATTTRLSSEFFNVDGGNIINHVFGRVQCFLHNNEYHKKHMGSWSTLGFGKKFPRR